MILSKDLKEAGLKVTVPRSKILTLLESSNQHLTAEDIYQQLHDGGNDISLATVYRVLAQFESAGLVIRHNFGEGSAIYELNEGQHHDHLVCIKCSRVEEFVDEVIEQRQREIANSKLFEMTNHSLYIFGICPGCQV